MSLRFLLSDRSIFRIFRWLVLVRLLLCLLLLGRTRVGKGLLWCRIIWRLLVLLRAQRLANWLVRRLELGRWFVLFVFCRCRVRVGRMLRYLVRLLGLAL